MAGSTFAGNILVVALAAVFTWFTTTPSGNILDYDRLAALEANTAKIEAALSSRRRDSGCATFVKEIKEEILKVRASNGTVDESFPDASDYASCFVGVGLGVASAYATIHGDRDRARRIEEIQAR